MMNFEWKGSSRLHWTDALPNLRRLVEKGAPLLIASDFDGTLAPLVDHPSAAALPSEVRAALHRISALPERATLAFVSGRKLVDLLARLDPSLVSCILAGNHGLEICGDSFDWVHPQAIAARKQLRQVVTSIEDLIYDLEGAELEDKGLSVTFHYRRMALENAARVREILARLELPPEIQRHEGKMVIEFRPHVNWNKGLALRKILQHRQLPDHATIYLGDDVTDEDVFRELERSATTIHVGSPVEQSQARFQASNPHDVADFLHHVARLLEEA